MNAQIITADILRTCHLKESMHLNGGSRFFGYGYSCIEHPRLRKIVKYWKKDRSTSVEWFVDGKPADTLEDAANRLNAPPSVTPAQKAVLEKTPTEFGEWHKGSDWDVYVALGNMGLLEYENGKCRRADRPFVVQEAAPDDLPI